jgi:hypothetical protein
VASFVQHLGFNRHPQLAKDTSNQWIDRTTQSGDASGPNSLPTPKCSFPNDGVAKAPTFLFPHRVMEGNANY